jgi:hypothetical protein
MVENITDIGAAESLSFAPAGQTPKQFGSTFFRGDNCNFYPTHADYDTIEGIRTFLLKGWIPSRPALNKYSKITAFGSCFASNITTYLTKIGYDLSKNRDEGVYISSMGEGLVNVHAILQQFEWALKSVIPPTNLWHGFKAEEFGYSEDVRTRTRTIFLNTDFFIITLGLSEIWYDEITGGIFWRAIPMKYYDENRHKFRVCSFQETKDAITSIYRIITEYIPNAKILFTLSPIPLAATFRPSGCIVANSASKSILRAAIDEFCRENEPALNERLFYFPSFEIVNELFYNKFTFDDNRHPHPSPSISLCDGLLTRGIGV